MPYLGIFGLKFKRTIVIFETSTLKFVYLQNLGEKIKMPKFGTKSALFVYFCTRILKNYFHICTVKLVKNESLTDTMDFGIVSAFSKGLGSDFSAGPSPGLGLLYKVCHVSEL